MKLSLAELLMFAYTAPIALWAAKIGYDAARRVDWDRPTATLVVTLCGAVVAVIVGLVAWRDSHA